MIDNLTTFKLDADGLHLGGLSRSEAVAILDAIGVEDADERLGEDASS